MEKQGTVGQMADGTDEKQELPDGQVAAVTEARTRLLLEKGGALRDLLETTSVELAWIDAERAEIEKYSITRKRFSHGLFLVELRNLEQRQSRKLQLAV